MDINLKPWYPLGPGDDEVWIEIIENPEEFEDPDTRIETEEEKEEENEPT